MLRLNHAAIAEVGNCSTQLEYAMIGARAQLHAFNRQIEQLARVGRKRAEACHIAGTHVRVGVQTRALTKALRLAFAGCDDTRPDICTRLGALIAEELVVLHTRHLKVQVDPVQQRSADARLIAADHGWRAGAASQTIAMVPAVAGVHRGDEQEVGGER